MLQKSFNELLAVDISKYVKKRDGIDYLPWAACKKLLHENGAETVYYTPLTNSEGSSLFMSDQVFTDKNGVPNRCYEVRVEIVIDNNHFVMSAPVMNGTSPVKDNSMTQQRVHNAQTRAFVKGVAVYTGLGFGLWLDDDDMGDSLEMHNIMKIKQRIEETLTAKINKGLSLPKILSAVGINEKQFNNIMRYFETISTFEQRLQKI